MKRFSFYTISFCVLFVFMSVLVKAQVNPNGGFENGAVGEHAGTEVPGFDFQVAGGADAVFSIVTDTEFVHSGAQALKIEVNAVGGNAWEPQVINQDFKVMPGDTFNVSAWVKCDVEGPIANFTVGSLSPNYYEWGRVHQRALTTEWQQVTWQVVIQGNTNDEPRAGVPIHLGEAANSAFLPFTVYLDDIVVTPQGVVNPNGGFEDAVMGEHTGTEVSGYDFQVAGGADAVFEVVDDSEFVHSGLQSLKVSVNAVGGNAWEPQVINQDFAVMPQDTFDVSVWVKCDTEGPIANFTVGSLSPNYYEWGRVHQRALTTEWQEVTWQVVIQGNTNEEPRAGVPIHLGEAANADFLPFAVYFDDIKVKKVSGGIVGIEGNGIIPANYSLSQNYPNPFNPTTTISFSLPERTEIHLQLIDVLGKVVSEVASGSFDSGEHQVKLDASRFASGVYFYRLQAGQFVSTKKLVLMK